MTVIGSATKAMFKAIMRESYYRILKYFQENTDVYQCFWAKDEFLDCNASLYKRYLFQKRHPEIEDLNNHTLVYVVCGMVYLTNFCPRLKAGIKELYEAGEITYESDGLKYYIDYDSSIDNYTISCIRI